MTAAKPEEANHKERMMDAAPLSRSLKPQLIFMSSFTNSNKKGISKIKVFRITTINIPKRL